MPQSDAPGLKKMRRPSGRIDCYWVADEKLVKKGYTPKTVNLHGDITVPIEAALIASTCRRLQAEMLSWASGQTSIPTVHAVGTIGWLCETFETHQDSPYRDKRQATRDFYARYLSVIKRTVGDRRIDTVSGVDIRRWHKNWKEKTVRGAYGCIQTLRRAVSFGVELPGNTASLRLAAVLREMRFETPKRRKERVTYDQMVAFRAKAHELDEPAMALAMTLQFDLMIRQKDVIGEWLRLASDERAEGAIAINGKIWHWGLTWSHISPKWQLVKPTSKSNGEENAEHDLTLLPDALAELQKIPPERRVGPVVINPATGMPYTPSHFSRKFRTIATAAGLPTKLWNMDSRAGGVTEALNAGAGAVEVMNAATHTEMTTTLDYDRDRMTKTRKVAKLRVASRNTTGTGHGNSHGNKPPRKG